MLVERDRILAGRHVHIQRWYPDGLLPLELVRADGESTLSLRIRKNGEFGCIGMKGGILAEPARRVRVAIRDKIRPDDLQILELLLWLVRIGQRESESVHIAGAGTAVPSAIFQALPRF